MEQIFANERLALPLGQCGENLARQVVFDVADWETLYGDGIAELVYQRHGDERPYIMEIEKVGTQIRWDITSWHTAISDGSGRCELRYYVGETLKKSRVWRTRVGAAMGTPREENPPDAESGWVDNVLRAAVSVEGYATAAEQSAKNALDSLSKAPMIQENGNWWVWDVDTESYMDTGRYAGGIVPHVGANGNWYVGTEDSGVAATGPQGAKGDTGATGLQGPRGDSGLPAIVELSGATQSLAIANNTDYRCADALTSLTVTGFDAGAEGRIELWSIAFLAGDGITVALPDTVVWNYGATPVFTAGSEYHLVFIPLLSGKVLGVWNEVEA